MYNKSLKILVENFNFPHCSLGETSSQTMWKVEVFFTNILVVYYEEM